MSRKIRVVVVDDSLVSQRLYRQMILDDDRFELLALASNGQQAIDIIEKLKPDVVSMDINMPVMDGIESTRFIMQTNPLPIVIVSSFYNPSEQEMAIEVLEAGAVSIMSKPSGPGNPSYEMSKRRYLNMLKSMSEVKVVKRRSNYKQAKEVAGKSGNDSNMPIVKHRDYKVLLIGASAGGPEGLKIILSNLTPAFPLPVLIVQHIDPHFSEGFRLWLQTYSGIPVTLAVPEQTVIPGHAYLAPGNKHMVVKSEGMVTLIDTPPEKGHKPSVSQLFRSAGFIYGRSAIAVILSGMGSDGAIELKALKDFGALTFAQNKSTCVVNGMPGEAVRLGGASAVMPPVEIVREILNIFTHPELKCYEY